MFRGSLFTWSPKADRPFKAPPHGRRLLLEPLEDRRMLSDESVPYLPPYDPRHSLRVDTGWDAASATLSIQIQIPVAAKADWGQIVQYRASLTADVELWISPGEVTPPWGAILSHQYRIGDLAPGGYHFLLTAWAYPLNDVSFTIPNPTMFNGTPGDDVFAFSTDGTYHYVSVIGPAGATNRKYEDPLYPVDYTLAYAGTWLDL